MDDGYDIQGEANGSYSIDSGNVISIIDIFESPQIVVISSSKTDGEGDRENEIPRGIEGTDKEDSWRFGSKTNNSNNPFYKPQG